MVVMQGAWASPPRLLRFGLLRRVPRVAGVAPRIRSRASAIARKVIEIRKRVAHKAPSKLSVGGPAADQTPLFQRPRRYPEEIGGLLRGKERAVFSRRVSFRRTRNRHLTPQRS